MTTPEPDRIVTACVLIIGNEILSGRTQDANVQFLAKGLNAAGVRLREVRVIPDVPETIVETVNDVRARFDYVLTTGGIGPTHDDITAECVARAFGVPLILDPEARRRLEVRYRDANPELELNEARLRMAHVPEGATLVDNPISAAPGFQIGNVFVLAGVPSVMQAMFDSLRHRLDGGKPVISRGVSCRLPEGTIAAPLEAIQNAAPAIDIGSYPMYSRAQGYRTSLVLRGTDEALLADTVEAVRAMIRSLGDEPADVELT